MTLAPAPIGIVPRLHVFLSYRNPEARFADVLKEHLIQDFIGLVEVFLASDTTSVPAGSRWLEEIVKGLQQAQLQIIICSNYSMYRPWINYEAGAARVLEIPIVPLCHSGLVPDQLPVPLCESEGGVLTRQARCKSCTRVSPAKSAHSFLELISKSMPRSSTRWKNCSQRWRREKQAMRVAPPKRNRN
jgi:hypothetical protein